MWFQAKKKIVLTATTMATLNSFYRVVEVLTGERVEVVHVTIENDTGLHGDLRLGGRRERIEFVYDELRYLKLSGISYQIGTREADIILIRNDQMKMPDTDIPAVRKGTCAADAQLVPLFS